MSDWPGQTSIDLENAQFLEEDDAKYEDTYKVKRGEDEDPCDERVSGLVGTM